MNESELLYRQILTRMDQVTVQKIQIEERVFNYTRDIMMMENELLDLAKAKETIESGGNL